MTTDNTRRLHMINPWPHTINPWPHTNNPSPPINKPKEGEMAWSNYKGPACSLCLNVTNWTDGLFCKGKTSKLVLNFFHHTHHTMHDCLKAPKPSLWWKPFSTWIMYPSNKKPFHNKKSINVRPMCCHKHKRYLPNSTLKFFSQNSG